MVLRGIDFGRCWDQSGVRGFFGEGYLYHKPLRPFGLSFNGSTLTTKTTTLPPHVGNMPLKNDGITPKEFKPKCIVVDWRNRVALNAVALSGPGAKFLLETGHWQVRKEPFCISFMSILKEPAGRLEELRQFVALLKPYLPYFKAPVCLQINFSCPNVKVAHDMAHLADEVREALMIASQLGIPVIPKFNVVLPVAAVLVIARDPNCEAICVSNTIPWGQLADKIDWKSFFDETGISPLAHLGGGGLSGAPLLPLVEEWVMSARAIGITKPIIAGGGILGPKDAEVLVYAGASAVAVGSMSMLAPWNMQRTIYHANRLGAQGEFRY
jgi:dihydroorotate dehydrogenase